MLDRAIIFVAIIKDNYVKMACNAAMTFSSQNIHTILLTSRELHEKHKDLISKYFQTVHYTETVDPGKAKMEVLSLKDAKTILYIDADSLASFSCNLNESFEYFETKNWDFWVWAYSVTNTEGHVQNFWANMKRMKERFPEILENKKIANGTQSSFFFFNTQSEKVQCLAKKTIEVFESLKNNRIGLTSKWMRDFIPDELLLTISCSICNIDVDNFTDNFIKLGLIERTNKIDRNYFYNDRNIMTFPSGSYKLRSSLKNIYNEVTLRHCREKSIKPFYSYQQKI